MPDRLSLPPGFSLRYKRFILEPGQRIGPLISKEKRRGIYILEFVDGAFYVGQTKNVVTRFAQHRHGHTNHVEPWADIVAVQFAHVPQTISLRIVEAHEIRRLLSQGFSLRNRALNFGHSQLSKLDSVISVDDQIHWATGGGKYNSIDMFESALIGRGKEGQSKASAESSPAFRKLLFDDLCFMLTSVIPNAAELEGRYWTISDSPLTSGGRWATVNTGLIEAMYISKKFLLEFASVDGEEFRLPSTTINLALEEKYEPDKDGFLINEVHWLTDTCNSRKEQPLAILSYPVDYGSVICEHLEVPTGKVAKVLTDFPELLAQARRFALAAMRQNEAGLYRRWHSSQLATEIYEGILERSHCHPLAEKD